jgi:uncharacterized protein YdiU (UPF0061 family)
MTIFFRRLGEVELERESTSQATDAQLMAPLMDAYYAPQELTVDDRHAIGDWLRRYGMRVREQGTPDAVRRSAMRSVNPKYVLRNYLAQLAIDKAEQDDGSVVRELLEVLRHPYDEQPQHEELARKRPDWARHRPGCSMLSCSS